MLTGVCRFGMGCRNHHPPGSAGAALSKQGMNGGSAPAAGVAATSSVEATANSSGVAPAFPPSGGQPSFVELDGQRLPVRPGKKPCPGLISRAGVCAHGMKCYFDHSLGLVAAVMKRRQKEGSQSQPEMTEAAVGNAGAAQGAGAGGKGEAGQEAATAALSELLAAVDRVWPPADHDRKPQSWALSRLTKFILIRAAWHVKKAASPPASSAATHEPKGVAAMLAIGGLSSVASTCMSAADLLRSGDSCGGGAVVLTNFGAELGPSWRSDPQRSAATPFDVKIGPLIRTDPLAKQMLIYEMIKQPDVWVSLRLEALMRLGGLIVAPPLRAAAVITVPAAALATGAATAALKARQAVVVPPAEGAAPLAPSPRPIIALPASVTKHLSIVTRPVHTPVPSATASPTPATAKPVPPSLCELLVSGQGWATELRPYSPPPPGPGGADGTHRRSIPEAVSSLPSLGSPERGSRDDAVWDLLALLPRG